MASAKRASKTSAAYSLQRWKLAAHRSHCHAPSLPSKQSGGPRASGGFTAVATAAAACDKSVDGAAMKRKRRDGKALPAG